jgi:hypothetical protein
MGTELVGWWVYGAGGIDKWRFESVYKVAVLWIYIERWYYV